jgi:hypothetical protein
VSTGERALQRNGLDEEAQVTALPPAAPKE